MASPHKLILKHGNASLVPSLHCQLLFFLVCWKRICQLLFFLHAVETGIKAMFINARLSDRFQRCSVVSPPQSPEEDAGKIMVAVEDGDSKLKELITVQEDQSLR